MNKLKRPLLLMILDGWGLKQGGVSSDAFTFAKTPNFDRLWQEYPHTELRSSGMAVGLPEGQMGNSEVGHMNIGAGRVIYQDLSLISRSIDDGSFFDNPQFKWVMDKVRSKGGALHLMGLLSNGGIHSVDEHLFALLKMAAQEGVENVFVHCFTDGRDTDPKSGYGFIKSLQEKFAEIGAGKIATVSGRFYAMDRDKRWDRVERAYRAMTEGIGEYNTDPLAMMAASYEKGITDEFIEPCVIDKDGLIKDNDGIIFYNYRSDRAREISHAFCDKEFAGFERKKYFPALPYVCMTLYDDTLDAAVAFAPRFPANPLGTVLSINGLRQLRIAETEKYAHVTFFFNGGVEKTEEGEERVLIPSPKVQTYDMQPEMSALLVTDAVCERIREEKYDVIILNYANPDMLGHTGNMEATVQALETVDACLGRVEKELKAQNGILVITADHGNVECMRDTEGNPVTSHTCGNVPFILVDEENRDAVLRNDGALENISPTVLHLLKLRKPGQMTGTSLIENKPHVYEQFTIDFSAEE